jgi:hypothetical protein
LAEEAPRRHRTSLNLSNEWWEHHMLSLELAGAIRAAGLYAEIEVPTEDGSWRGGVMASSPDDNQRMAWEGLAHSRLRSIERDLPGWLWRSDGSRPQRQHRRRRAAICSASVTTSFDREPPG